MPPTFRLLSVKFIPGDWRDTISGHYDVIVYDLGGDIPRDILAKHLNKGGIILPNEANGF